jgi:hypothetical protein
VRCDSSHQKRFTAEKWFYLEVLSAEGPRLRGAEIAGMSDDVPRYVDVCGMLDVCETLSL